MDYWFNDRSLLLEAMTHRSVKAEKGPMVRTNLRLELLGDSILGCVITEYLYQKYPNANKKALTEMRKGLVSNEALNDLAFAKGDNERFLYDLIVKGGSIEHNSSKAANMVADAVESIIAAIYLDGGLNEARTFIWQKVVGDCV